MPDTFIQFLTARPDAGAADRAERARTPEYLAGYAAAYERRPLGRQDPEYISGYLDEQKASFERTARKMAGVN